MLTELKSSRLTADILAMSSLYMCTLIYTHDNKVEKHFDGEEDRSEAESGRSDFSGEVIRRSATDWRQ